MLCQLSYEGLKRARLRRLPADSAKIVFSTQLRQRSVSCLLNSFSLPADSATERDVPGDCRAGIGKIAAAAYRDAALAGNGHETFGHNAGRYSLAEKLGQPRSEERRVGKECRSRWS